MNGCPTFPVDSRMDCSYQLCPVPIIMTEERIDSLKESSVLEVTFTDRQAKPDLWAWCRATGHEFLGFRDEKIKSYAYIQKHSKNRSGSSKS